MVLAVRAGRSTDASGQDADTGFEAALTLPEFKDSGLSLVSHEHFNVTDLSVSAQIARMRATNPQVVIAYSPGTPFGTLLQGFKQSGLDLPIATGTANMTYAEMKQYAQFIPRQMIHVGRESDSQRARYLRRIQTEHVAIFEAIRAQSPAAARKAARRHLSNALNRYQQAAANSPHVDESTELKPAPDGLAAQPR